MRLRTSLTFTLLCCVLLPGAAAHATWIHLADSFFVPEKNNQKHPGQLTRTMIIDEDTEGSRNKVCSVYLNNHKHHNRGAVKTKVRIDQADGGVQRIHLNGKVRRNSYAECVKVGKLAAGDLLTFDFEFRGMAPLKLTDKRLDYFTAFGAVTTLQNVDAVLEQLDPEPEPEPDPPDPVTCPDPDPQPNPQPNPQPDPQAGPLSVADQKAINRLRRWAKPNRGVALRFEASGVTVDWRIGQRAHHMRQKFSTIAAAVNQFFRVAPP